MSQRTTRCTRHESMTISSDHKLGALERARSYYDDFAETYERHRGDGYHALIDELQFEWVRPFARDATVLEVGCGTGLILGRLADVTDHAMGIDVSPQMIHRAAARGHQVALATATQLPFADDTFDVVCSFKVLAHVPEIERALAEATRVLRPGGHLVVDFYNPWSLRYLAKKAAGPGSVGRQHNERDLFTRWDSPRQARKLFPRSLDIVSCRGVRVLTPFASAHNIPWVSEALRRLEHKAADSPLKCFGGFLVFLLRKRSDER